ncbi:MAG: DNA gyrase C-terminal beta-propeller domain-containing protein, partial [Planctomycetia bacterium]
YNLTRVQADVILQMQLQRLTALEQDKILGEYAAVRKEISEYETLLSADENIYAVIREDMLEIKRKYGDDRRTQIDEAEGEEFNREDLITEETNVVTVSHSGYIKRMQLSAYRTQARGGRGVTGGNTKEGDFLKDVFVASTHAYILFFTDRGQCYWLKVYDIAQMDRTALGRAIVNLLNLRPEERISSYVPVRTFDGRSVFMITRNGTVKKTSLSEYSRPKAGGIIGIQLVDGDELVSVLLTSPGDHVLLATKKGMSIRFDEALARAMGRDTRGVKGIELEDGDEVVGGVVVPSELEGTSLLTVCARGYGKRSRFEEYRVQGRGGKGIIDIKRTERNGDVVAVATVRDDDEVMFITQEGMVVRTKVDGISVYGRNTQGVTLMRITDDDRIMSMARIAREDVKDVLETAESDGDAPPAVDGPEATPLSSDAAPPDAMEQADGVEPSAGDDE